MLLLLCSLPAQIRTNLPDLPSDEKVQAAGIPLPCPSDPCPCVGGYIRIQVYYFGPNNVTVTAFSNSGLTNVITTFNNVMNGQLLTINGAGLPGGQLAPYTYLRVNNAGDICTTRLFTRCPTEGYPNATGEQDILGKTFRNFTVYTVTDTANNVECSIENADQDWHVGGNIVGNTKNTLGTRNNENVVLITNDLPRGVITNTGNFGLGTNAPTARLHVSGSAIVEQNLDVNGLARVNNAAVSTTPANGALTVTGGAGIGQNLNVAGNGYIAGNLGVGIAAPITDLHVEGTGLRLSNGGQRLDQAIGIGQNSFMSTGANLMLRSPSGNHIFINTGVGDGKVAIGTTSIPNILGGSIDISTYKLYVQGGILTEELRVRTGWADYVFGDNYRLQPLEEVECFIRDNGHLPNMPTEKEVLENGLSVGEAAVKQQEKIEEIYLHLIEMDKQIKALQAENAVLKTRIQELEH